MARPTLEWGKKKTSSPPKYKIEDKWMVSYEHTTSANGTFYFKAGNKDYTLDGNTKSPTGKMIVSEAMLKKKYEYIFLLFLF
jgi:hypothetical protein